MEDFTLLKRFIEQTLAIQCSNYKEDYIKRRVSSRMRSTNCVSFGDYLRYLKANPPELENLRNALTINVTEFFRDADVYEVMKKDILPGLFKQRKRLRIWCAGCSTGEEPYSLAMMLSELMAQNPEDSQHRSSQQISIRLCWQKSGGDLYPKSNSQIIRSSDPPPFHQTSGGNFSG